MAGVGGEWNQDRLSLEKGWFIFQFYQIHIAFIQYVFEKTIFLKIIYICHYNNSRCTKFGVNLSKGERD